MPAGLRRAMAVTDGLMLLYWLLTALVAFGLLHVPSDYLYRGYDDPLLVAWNWSFMPLDIAFSLLGLWALHRARLGLGWRGPAIVSLTLTMCAGGMAIAFWTLVGDFNLSWWLPNLALLLWPLAWLPGLLKGVS
ncbi:MAG: hypothetical protein CFE37_01600 [Alphaproteobacteria bacterium PA4]|nr:MAG: hypothetical protein CFE37_01600 [Alphaproteobacteria bacterium PA4]